jgi:hypothetical protein
MRKLRAMVDTNAKNSLENAKNARLNKKPTICCIGMHLWNVTYKVFAKILYDRLLPHANAAVQH